ncbi:MAG TPA: DUF1697 domain-containing protein [Anaerolineaceae bacterium]
MTRCIAFLRAINVGGHVVKMDRLRQLFETMGFSRVETFIASGNVLFDAGDADPHALEARISMALREALGYEVACFIRSADEVRAAAACQPFPLPGPESPAAAVYVGFLTEPLSDQRQRALMEFRSAVDEFHTQGREIYWRCLIRSSDSQFSLARLEKALGIQATFRNSTTLRKMAGLLD